MVVGINYSKFGTNLTEVQVLIQSNSEYLKRNPYINTTTQFCAGRYGLGNDSCNNDDGGPLVRRGSNGRWHLIGISSVMGRCADGGFYAKVSAFASWMRNVVATN